MRILLTGAGGQVGSEITRHLAMQSADCVLIPLTRSQLDITHEAAVLQAFHVYQPDVVVNAAAYTKVDQAEVEPSLAYAINARGAANVAAACHQFNLPLIHFSTDYIFDGSKPSAYTELDLAAPQNVYGISKWQGEEAVRQLCPRHIILRTSWVYGKYGQNFVKTILRLAKERSELKVVDDQKGCPTAATDIADVVVHLLPELLNNPEISGTFHFCSGATAVSWYQFAQQIIKHAAQITPLKVQQVLPIPTTEYPLPAKRPPHSLLGCEKILSTFSIEQPSWIDTLPNFIQSCLYE